MVASVWLKSLCFIFMSPQTVKGRSRTMWPLLTWGTADLSDINSMVLNKLRLAERQRTKIQKNLFHFLLMTTTCFITSHRKSRWEREEDRKQERDLFWRRNFLYKPRITDLWSFQFCRVLTDVGGAYETSQSTVHSAVVFNFIKCTFIVVYYDDDMTECTDDSHYTNSVDRFFKNFYWETALGS